MEHLHVRLMSADPLPRNETFLTRVPVPGEVVRLTCVGEGWDLEVDRVIHTPNETGGCAAVLQVHRVPSIAARASA